MHHTFTCNALSIAQHILLAGDSNMIINGRVLIQKGGKCAILDIYIQYIHTNISDVLTGSDNICSNLTTFDTLRQDMSKVETRNDLRWVS